MKIGIIGGSGLYELEGIQNLREQTLSTPFGEPSDRFVTGTLHGKDVVFLPRHGRGHRLLPSEVPFRANVWGMKKLGVTHLISVSAVGSLREEIKPGHLVFPDQFIDRTFHRESTFFGKGIVAHVQFGKPVCDDLLTVLAAASRQEGITAHRGGTYICMEGPQFSTQAESHLYRSWGGAVIGMTNLQEAKLAREAELCFATIALATDYDCWHASEAEVSVEAVLEVMRNNVAASKRLLAGTIRALNPGKPCPDQDALRFAILTTLDRVPEAAKRDLAPMIGRYVNPPQR
jgi:5'-methylthioadenosine phosphorylase